jgi:hypothetical protein
MTGGEWEKWKERGTSVLSIAETGEKRTGILSAEVISSQPVFKVKSHKREA